MSVGAFVSLIVVLLLITPLSVLRHWSETEYTTYSFRVTAIVVGLALLVVFVQNLRNALMKPKPSVIGLLLVVLAVAGQQLAREYEPGDHSLVAFWALALIAPLVTTPAIIHRMWHRC